MRIDMDIHKDWHCICSCGSHEHQVNFDYWEDLDGDKNVYMTIHLAEYPFWKRLWRGLKYIFGHKSNYGNFDEFILSKKHAPALREIADILETLDE